MQFLPDQPMRSRSIPALRYQQRGLSLVEVMISLVIGLVVVGAVLISYIGSGQTNKRQVAYAEMNENAQIGFSLLRRDLMLAGYSQTLGVQAVGIPPVSTFARTFSGRAIFGCDVGFDDYNSSAGAICKTGAPDKPAIEISYEADVSNTVPVTVAGVPTPSDCLGNSLNAQTAGTVPVTAPPTFVTFYTTNNRYYLATGSTGRSELHCAGSRTPATPGQPLVDNVEDMQILYGEAAAGSRRIVRYVNAANVTSWQNIISVRVCLLMRSAETVLNAEDVAAGANAYLDCNSATQASADGYARRAYFMTTALRNKMSL
jgi:type IV pilus assembly protein PilW